MHSYNGGRTAEDILAFVNQQSGTHARIAVAPSDVVVLNEDNFDQFAITPRVMFISRSTGW